MFGLFKKKDKGVPAEDRIWMNEQAKWQACLELYQQNKQIVFIAWFDESKLNLQHYLESRAVTDAHIIDANFANSFQQNNDIVFIEHFPLHQEEQNKFQDLGLSKAIIYSSLDEALFDFFGGGKIVALMQKMGMKESEMIQHSMITASIKRAQEKIAEKTMVSGSARSQRDWLINAGINSATD